MSGGTGSTTGSGDVDRILVAGATGKTGKRALGHLAGRSVAVRATTRAEANAGRLRERGADDVVVGDLLEPSVAERAVVGVDAVVTCVGSTPLQVHLADEHVDGRGNRNLIEAADAGDPDRFVMLSSLGTDPDPSSWQARFFRLVVGPVVRAKAETERALRSAALRHTVLRPGLLLSYGPGGAAVADAGAGLWGAVTRGYLAKLLVAATVTPAATGRTFEVAGNPLLGGVGVDVDWQLPG